MSYITQESGAKLLDIVNFSASGTYTPNAKTKFIKIRMVAGGGGGKGASNNSGNGSNGGTSSFGTLATCIGGTGATSVASGGAAGSGGTIDASGEGFHLTGSAGAPGNSSRDELNTQGGASCFPGASAPWNSAGLTPGDGGSGGHYFTGNDCSGGGGAGEYCEATFPIAALGATETVTIGTGGTVAGNGGAGAAGYLVVEEWG